MNIQNLLSNKIYQALLTAGANPDCEPQVCQTSNPQFGDYQANGIMEIAKNIGLQPRFLAERVVNLLQLNDIAYKVDIVDPGFINIFLQSSWLEKHLFAALSCPRLGIKAVLPKTIVVDYSSPNVAKEMHVGHLRSTIIGDASVRTLSFLGHTVIRANHIGDWGTQFGMLIAYLEKVQYTNETTINLSKLENFYRAAKQHYDEDLEFAKRARSYTVQLQKGNEYCRQLWRKLVDITISQNQKIYERLNVTLTREDIMGESLYSTMLSDIVEDLKEKGMAVVNKGASIIFLNEFKNKEGNPMGVIIQKKDGAYLYTTTDIACAKYRYETLQANRVIYYVDSRQHQHLVQAWTIARKAGYIPESVSFEHHMFGMILGKDKKPFKTRAGNTIKLVDLLDEALERARRVVLAKHPAIDTKELETLAKIIGIGALKYADLSKNRNTDYVFNWDNMLTFEGNTAPYIQYAYARIISIFKRIKEDNQNLNKQFFLKTTSEHQLAVHLLKLEETITIIASRGTPHVLCSYLYDLAVLFSTFYEKCPILKTADAALRESRLQLAILTARTIKQGLDLLGIQTVERM
ncbi:arginyl-tRNA synthetase [secondary endosymbiont of Heteropsylla cubana]|uniref:Arginine--tRNA ligase n=1 Tax=secondary endosymbiont of Heteropsylla cubana TaxID=134287 RepID=J3Z540_9ENTR|nr:arginine--tRNA ligase [secondary endosymbiont of Heteropsylla cubana]AFP85409.1 arginyl-tRNA synthetase [secondary endosymbiont of Heteropsylla cubana]